MFKKSVILGAAAALLLTLGTTTQAGPQTAGVFTMSPMVGFSWSGLDTLVNSADSPEDTWGFAVGYNFTESFSAEALFSQTEYGDNISGGQIDTQYWRLWGLYNFNNFHEQLVPYLGLGYTNRRDKVPGMAADNDGLITAGGGFKWFFNPHVALRLDLAYHIDSSSSGYNDTQFLAGLEFPLGVPQPVMAPKDSDGDGVTDDKDRCPNTPRGTKVDAHGCPIPPPMMADPDSDGDGVPDSKDQCPNTPKGVEVDEVGCPILQPPERMEIKIEFDFDRAEIRPQYHALLGDVAAFMDKHPNAVATIEGHTDSTGPESYNQGLSERRANSVRDHLVENNKVEGSRLKTVGFGETRPIASNSTRDGRQRNRRVIAVIIESR